MGRQGLFTAEQLAALFSLSATTINDYAQLGLLQPVETDDGVLFAAGNFTRLEGIKKGRCLGFSLGEIKLLIDSAKRP